LSSERESLKRDLNKTKVRLYCITLSTLSVRERRQKVDLDSPYCYYEIRVRGKWYWRKYLTSYATTTSGTHYYYREGGLYKCDEFSFYAKYERARNWSLCL
jgi:hypothetical protein